MKQVTLVLPLTAFERLHEKADGRGDFARINKEALRCLLRDHSALIAALQNLGVSVEDAYENSDKVRQASAR